MFVGFDVWRGEGTTTFEGKHYSHDTTVWMLKGALKLGIAWGLVRIVGFLWRSGDPKSVEVRAESAILPRKGWRRGFLTARFQDIRSIVMKESEKEDEDKRTLTVDTNLGTSRLVSSGFQSMDEFDEFSGLLITRWKALARPNPLIPKKARANPPHEMRPQDQALLAAIADTKKTDPLIGAKLAGKEILARLIAAMTNERGVHAPSLLCALGALAGYACQASVRSRALITGQSPDALLVVVDTTDGKQFYFGDALNEKLAEHQYSVWSLAAGGAQHAGAKSLPDLKEIFTRVAASLGTEQFGIPKSIEGHPPGDLPMTYLKGMWSGLLPVIKKLTGDPELWPVACGLAIQEAIALTSSALPPELGLTIVMEAAIPMSKVKL
jgi:hypothetical protein